MPRSLRQTVAWLGCVAALTTLTSCVDPNSSATSCPGRKAGASWVLYVDDVEMGRFSHWSAAGDVLHLWDGAFYPRRFVRNWKSYNSGDPGVTEEHDLTLIRINTPGVAAKGPGYLKALETRVIDVTGQPAAGDDGCLIVQHLLLKSPAARRH